MFLDDSKNEWSPLSLVEVVRLFKGARFPWWFVGCYAVELAIGRPLRFHGDIDVLVLRKYCLEVRQFFKNWDCWTSDPNSPFALWPLGEKLSDQAHDIWCR